MMLKYYLFTGQHACKISISPNGDRYAKLISQVMRLRFNAEKLSRGLWWVCCVCMVYCAPRILISSHWYCKYSLIHKLEIPNLMSSPPLFVQVTTATDLWPLIYNTNTWIQSVVCKWFTCCWFTNFVYCIMYWL